MKRLFGKFRDPDGDGRDWIAPVILSFVLMVAAFAFVAFVDWLTYSPPRMSYLHVPTHDLCIAELRIGSAGPTRFQVTCTDVIRSIARSVTVQN
jgi:hypothetical protein